MNNKPSIEQVKARVIAALKMFFLNDIYLLEKDVNERSISHRVATYLQYVFNGWDVDCEYNRDHNDPKYIQNVRDFLNRNNNEKIDIADVDATTAYPDIIIHERGTNDSNLLAIEIKKTIANAHIKFGRQKSGACGHRWR